MFTKPRPKFRPIAWGISIVLLAGGGLASCRDDPTAPQLSGFNPSLDVQVTAIGTPASQLPQSEVIAAITDPTTSAFVAGIAFLAGQPQQVAVLTTPDGEFPTDGSSYLVISSGDARDPRVDGGWTWHPGYYPFPCTVCVPGSGDSASIRVTVAVPPGATTLEIDYRFFTADNVGWYKPQPWIERAAISVSSATEWLGGSQGSPWHIAECGSIPIVVRCTDDFTWFPGGVHRLTVDVGQYVGQLLFIRALTSDYGPNNLRQTGLAIDRLHLVISNRPPIADGGGPYVIDEGTSFQLDGSASSDPEGEVLAYAWDLDEDGAYDDATAATLMHTFPENGSYPVALRVTDPQGASGTAMTTVIVRNVAPNVSVDAPSLVHPAQAQANVPLAIRFTDPGADTHSATIDCDNGAPPVSLTNAMSPFEHSCAYTATAFGARTVRLTVTDDDGGSGTVSYALSILYVWGGFLQPVSGTVLNTASAGRAIPLKFRLDGNQGLSIFAANSPASRLTSCEGDPIGVPLATSTPGNSWLTYDPGTRHYHYVWKTEKAWAGSCRMLDVRLADGTVHSALFRFK